MRPFRGHAPLADCLVRLLESQGVSHIFGSPGTSELPLVVAAAESPSISFMFTVHESISVGMADGYARASGQPGVVVLHATQGALNGAGFIRVALHDNSPVVCIAGMPARSYAIHEPNHFVYGLADIMRHITRWSWELKRPEEGPQALGRAISIALNLPQGPTFLGIPQDDFDKEIEDRPLPVDIRPHYTRPAEADLDTAAMLLAKAKRPLIYAGNLVGRYGAVASLLQLAERLGAYVINEALDRGPLFQTVNMPLDHPLSLGFFSSNHPRIKQALANCDVLFIVGAKSTYPRVIGQLDRDLTIIQLDVDPNELGKNHQVTLGMIGAPRETLKALLSKLSVKAAPGWVLNAQPLPTGLPEHKASGTLLGDEAVKVMCEVLPHNVIIVHDSQCMGYYLKHGYPFAENMLFGQMGSHLGWANAAAAGVKLARTDHPVVCVASDISFLFGIQALYTIAKYNIPVIYLVANNQGSSSLQIELMEAGYPLSDAVREVFTHQQVGIDLVHIAQGFGVEAQRASTAEELRNTLNQALESHRPFVIDLTLPTDVEIWRPTWRFVQV